MTSTRGALGAPRNPAYGVSSKSLGRSKNILDRRSFDGRVIRVRAAGCTR